MAFGMSQTLGEFVRAQRLAAGMSREDLASRAGLSFPGIQLIETGRRTDPRASTVVRLSRALAVTADQLLQTVG
jgi:transcriptional regulator with XRE-family HTH domain